MANVHMYDCIHASSTHHTRHGHRHDVSSRYHKMRPSFLSLRSYFQTTSDFAITYLKNKGLQPNIDDIFGNMDQRNVLKRGPDPKQCC